MFVDKPWFNRFVEAAKAFGGDPQSGGTLNKTLFIETAWGFIERGRDRKPGEDRDLARFMAFCILNEDGSNAQLLQDLWALWETRARGKQSGFFVEFGVCGGRKLSNTYLLERNYGWQGIVAEPNPAFHTELLAARKCHISTKCVYSTSGAKLQFSAASVGELSGITAMTQDDAHAGRRRDATHIEVETISLNDLLAQHGAPAQIDYLSIDTEGSEYEILRHMDFARWPIGLITVEHNGTANREKIYDLLVANGYARKFAGFSRFDDWYVHSTY
jgi:FkbM family methyltransferase